MNFQRLLKDVFVEKPLEFNRGVDIIHEKLNSDSPLMIGRFGSTEIKALLYPTIPVLARGIVKNKIFSSMSTCSGFFPADDKTIRQFSDLMLNDAMFLDILGSWRIEELFIRDTIRNVIKVELKCLEPYFSDRPWTAALHGKNVLVVHPFSSTIEHQYFKKREKLFLNQNILPTFKSLTTIKAVQTLAGNKSGFLNWFEALDFMKEQVNKLEFDVAILGCGAYGFPLAAHIKRMGKKAVHLGGATQILFGIRGRRWDDHPIISNFYNEHWVSPLAEDMPLGAMKVENGCYW